MSYDNSRLFDADSYTAADDLTDDELDVLQAWEDEACKLEEALILGAGDEAINMSNWEKDYGFGPSDRRDLQGEEEWNADAGIELKDKATEKLLAAVEDYLDAGGSVRLLLKLVAEQL